MPSWITKLLKSKKKLFVIPALVLATGGTALAVVSTSNGGAQLQMLNRGDNVPSVTSSTTFSDVPGAARVVGVPSGATRLINARFTAESQCTRAILPVLGGGCSTRIVAQRIGGATVELNPQAGLDYRFDTVASDGQEGHAMERSIRLGAGTYVIRAQRAVTSNAVSFRLDDWHLAVEVSA